MSKLIVNNGNINFEKIFSKYKAKEKLKQESESDSETPIELYITLKLKSNYKEPMRRFYQLSAEIAKKFCINVSIEEVADGFLMFWKKQEDLQDTSFYKMLDKDWKEWISRKNLDLSDKEVQNLLKLLKSQLKKN